MKSSIIRQKSVDRLSEIFIDSYIISLWQEREGMWLGSHMTLHHRA